MKDLRQTKEYADFLTQIGWVAELISGQYYFIKKIPLFGCAIKLQRTSKVDTKVLQKLCKKYRVFQIIIEPEVPISSLKKSGEFKVSNSPFLPTKTIRVDITKKTEEILAQMKKDTRYSLRKSASQIVREEKSIKKFRDAWFGVIKHKRHVLPLTHMQAFKKSFGENMILLTNKDLTAGGMFIKTKDIAYYWIGFTSDKARDTQVQYQIIWSGMQWAKKNKAKVFDFEGIYDDRFPIVGWQGFTHFKKGFGGKEIEYPGCFVKWRLPF